MEPNLTENVISKNDEYFGNTILCFIFFSFVGCIKNLSINGYKKDLSTHSMTKYGNDPPTPKPGCPRDDSCLLFPCLHGGVCEGDWQGYRCQCQSGFHGYNCSEGKQNIWDLIIFCSNLYTRRKTGHITEYHRSLTHKFHRNLFHPKNICPLLFLTSR
jgi:hypothetical protein